MLTPAAAAAAVPAAGGVIAGVTAVPPPPPKPFVACMCSKRKPWDVVWDEDGMGRVYGGYGMGMWWVWGYGTDMGRVWDGYVMGM